MPTSLPPQRCLGEFHLRYSQRNILNYGPHPPGKLCPLRAPGSRLPKPPLEVMLGQEPPQHSGLAQLPENLQPPARRGTAIVSKLLSAVWG